MKLKLISILILFLYSSLPNLVGQTYSKPTRMTNSSSEAQARLIQDVALLKQQLGEMRFEVERLVRENESLELRLKKMEGQSTSNVSDVVLRQELASLRAEINGLNKTQREDLLAQIGKQIRALAEETEKSIASVANGGTPSGSPIVTKFDDSVYPQSGIFYVVRSGDTLSKIASDAGSRVSYIIHANKIPDPDRLQVGRELFIPIDNP